MPNDATKQQLLDANDPGVKAVVQMCLDDGGRPARVTLISSSCLPDYDNRILETMADWRYKPVEINGKPTAICTMVTYIYRQTQFRSRRGNTGHF